MGPNGPQCIFGSIWTHLGSIWRPKADQMWVWGRSPQQRGPWGLLGPSGPIGDLGGFLILLAGLTEAHVGWCKLQHGHASRHDSMLPLLPRRVRQHESGMLPADPTKLGIMVNGHVQSTEDTSGHIKVPTMKQSKTRKSAPRK